MRGRLGFRGLGLVLGVGVLVWGFCGLWRFAVAVLMQGSAFVGIPEGCFLKLLFGVLGFEAMYF